MQYLVCQIFCCVSLQVLFVENSRDPAAPVVTFAKGHGLDGPWGIAVGIVCHFFKIHTLISSYKIKWCFKGAGIFFSSLAMFFDLLRRFSLFFLRFRPCVHCKFHNR